MDNLEYNPKHSWNKLSEDEKRDVKRISDKYISFLNEAKTERLAVEVAIRKAESHGFKHIDEFDKLKPGDRVYFLNRKKNIILAIIGDKPITEGSHMVAAHIDAPRIDLKAVPIYEKDNLVLLKTHYYGGIKKYHWVNIPLEMHGVVALKNGKIIDIHIGNKSDDPVFVISDVLPHIGGKIQGDRKAAEVIRGEELNIIAGSIPDNNNKYKINFLKILNEKYGIKEEDLISAEISFVPNLTAKYVGIDKGLVGGYGQDDRICSFSALEAIVNAKPSTYTSLCFLVDKEEIGSEGNTGALSNWMIYVITLIMEKMDLSSQYNLFTTLNNMKIMSSDVNAAVNPTFRSIHDTQNAGIIGNGVIITKFSGSRGKSSTNDAHAEYIAYIRELFDKNGVNWQIGEWGKVDEGGAGTIAKFLARYNSEVIDIGPGLIGMHSTYELSHIVDIYSTYLAYLSFYEYNK